MSAISDAKQQAKKAISDAKQQAKKAISDAKKQAKKAISDAKKQAKKAISDANKQDPDIIRINERIKKETCYTTISLLTDEKLLPVYKKSESVIKELEKQGKMLDKYVNSEQKQNIQNDPDNILQLIPAGTKGVIRGKCFNDEVKAQLEKNNTDSDRFELRFEENCNIEEYRTSEKPDFTIREKSTNKIIIGMNQIDLWTGGAQINRGSKYIEGNKHNTEKSKLLCVVCNEVQLSSKKNKTFKLFETGFKNDTLCYLNNLQNIINSFFNEGELVTD